MSIKRKKNYKEKTSPYSDKNCKHNNSLNYDTGSQHIIKEVTSSSEDKKRIRKMYF